MARKWIAAAVALLLILGAIYLGSPYIAARNLKQAAFSGSSDQLDAAVDFPSVREGLKAQLSAALLKKMRDDLRLQNNPFAGLGMVMMPAIIDRVVEAYVTSDGVAALVRGNKPSQDNPPAGKNPDIRYETQWVSADRFRVKMSNEKTGQEGPSLLFKRRGFASWKLIKIELPEAMLGAS